MKLQTLRRIGEVPRARDHSRGHDPMDARKGRRQQCVKERSCGLPGGGAYDALATVLSFDRVELKVDVLREIPHKGENFAHALVHDAQCGENVHNGARDGPRTLLSLRQVRKSECGNLRSNIPKLAEAVALPCPTNLHGRKVRHRSSTR